MLLRRLLLLVALAAAGAIVASRWRTRTTPAPVDPPSWPPIRNPEPVEAGASAEAWMSPLADGRCPDGYPIKAKTSSGIYHAPGGRFYDRTNADRCYADPKAAEADGYRRSKT